MNNYHPVLSESQQPATSRVKRKKKSRFKMGWTWLLVAAVTYGVIYFGFGDLTEKVTAYTLAFQDHSPILTEMKESIVQLYTAMKDYFYRIIDMI